MRSSELKAFLELGQILESGDFQSFSATEVELETCSYAFIRGVDGLGKISTDLRGGNISFATTRIPSIGLLEWGINPDKYLTGNINFRDSAGESQSRIHFENAACVNMKISYENEGVGYFIVQCTLQAESIDLDGAKRFDNHWKNTKDMDISYNMESEVKDKAVNLLGVLLNKEASLNGYMELGGKEYQLRSFEMEFIQEVDVKDGEPQTSVRGGFASISLFQMPDKYINKWMRHFDGLDGIFRFGDPYYGYPLKIVFTEALCVGYFAQCMNNSKQNTVTRLNVSPKTLSVNGVDYTNFGQK